MGNFTECLSGGDEGIQNLSTSEPYQGNDIIKEKTPLSESLNINNDSSSNNNINNDNLEELKKEMEEIVKKNNEQKELCIKLNKEKNELVNKKNILESEISNLNKNKENLSKDLKKLEDEISNKKEILEKMKEDEKNMQNKMQNNIINKPQPNQLMQPNLGNNQVGQNNPNYGFVRNMNFFPNQNVNNNLPFMNNYFQNNLQRFFPNQNVNNNLPFMNNYFQNNLQRPNQNQIFNRNQNNYQIPYQIFNPNPNYQINKPIEHESEPISLYEKPTLIGLKNIGSKCYKNSVLQCLSQTRGLTNYFLQEKNYDRIMNTNISKQDKNQNQLCHIYYDLIQNLWKKDEASKSFSPEKFMNSLKIAQNDKERFGLYEARDTKNFIMYILERMHNELKQEKKIWKIEPKYEQLNKYDKNNTLIHFLVNFQKEISIISYLFYGFNELTNVCQYCKKIYNYMGQSEKIYYDYGISNILMFNLEDVRKNRNQNNKNKMVTMFECFNYLQQGSYFTGENKNYCNNCTQLTESVYTSKIFICPNILIIILDRGKENIYDIKLDFDLKMDISDFVLFKSGRQIYNLYGVVTNIGGSGPYAYFIASCKSPVDNNWYRYNDESVTPISDLKKDLIDYETPYILFYEKQN